MKLFLFNNDEKLIGTISPLEGIQNEEINKIQTIECTVVYSELIEKASYIGHKDYSDNRIFHLYNRSTYVFRRYGKRRIYQRL